jgi:tetratricopeptide (TPR) repeat protein
LAIQLAAAASHRHSCEEIACSLQRNLDFINTNMRNMPERHRSLRAAFAHSWDLLLPIEKAAFANLAVFIDGFSQNQAQAVANVSEAVLSQLINKSLIQQLESHSEGPTTQHYRRYRMHPVLHQYATEELVSDADNAAQRHKQHCLYFCRFATEQEAILGSTRAAEASAALTLEIENLRASWRYALAHRWADFLRTMLPALMRFYLLRGFLQDASALLEQAILAVEGWGESVPSEKQSRQRLLAHLFAHQAEVLTELGRYTKAFLASQNAIDHAEAATDRLGEALGHLHWGIALNCQGTYKPAKVKLQQCLALAQQEELSQVEATAQRYLGVNSFYQGDYLAGRLHHEAAIRLYQGGNDLVNELRTYHSLAMLYFYTGDYLQARQHYERCRLAYRAIGDRPTLALTLNNLGAVSSHLGDYTTALRSFEDALAIRRQIGDRQMEGLILANMGLLVHLMNNHQRALTYCIQALDVSLEVGERDTEAYARTCLGHALLEMGRIAEAVSNYEQAVQIRKNNDQLTQMLEPLAGLARAHLRLRDIKTALAYVEEILSQLNVHTYAGIVELIRIYLTCYRVLYLAEDARATGILEMGHMILQERAAKITDKQLRTYYFENIIAHRELMTEYETQRVT